MLGALAILVVSAAVFGFGHAANPNATLFSSLTIAIMGEFSAGKSTFVNALLGEERMITGPEAGITRDSITVDWTWQDRAVKLVDTAGLRKRAKVDDKLVALARQFSCPIVTNDFNLNKVAGLQGVRVLSLNQLSEAVRAPVQLLGGALIVAGLAAVDGAVVMTRRFELLGFGGEISGELEPVHAVRKAIDLEGESTLEESTQGVGTRHRSAYRLAAALPDVLLVVVSQDGDARFVRNKDGRVTGWDQA